MSESRCANVRRGNVLFAVAIGLLPCALPAHADLIQFTFTGEITEITGDVPEPWASIELGDPWEVNYVFDSEAKDNVSSPTTGHWFLESFTVTMAGFSSTTTNGDIRLDLNFPPPLDHYDAKGHELPVGGSGGIQLIGINAFEDDELPLLLDLNDFTFKQFSVGGANTMGNIYFVYGDILTFETSTVPNGAGWLLYLFVLLSQRLRRRVG